MYKNYIFDIYGTLVDINTDEDKNEIWEKLGLFYSYKGANYSAKEIKECYLEKVKNIKSEYINVKYPDFDLRRVFNELYEDKNIETSKGLIDDTAQMFRVLSINKLNLYDGVVEFLEHLKAKGKKLYVLSNAQRIFTLYEIKLLGIYEYFEDIFISSDYNVCKPESEFYKELIEKHNLNIEESIMIGNDYIADIYGGNNVGLNTAYIHSNLSPEIEGELKSNHILMEMDFKKLEKEILL
ncbi:MAG: HAD family hydrolase [Clostridium sp.]